MVKNKLSDLRNHLFAALERLDNDELTQEELDKEIAKANAVTNISNSIINSAKLEMSYRQHVDKLKSKGDDVGESQFLSEKVN